MYDLLTALYISYALYLVKITLIVTKCPFVFYVEIWHYNFDFHTFLHVIHVEYNFINIPMERNWFWPKTGHI